MPEVIIADTTCLIAFQRIGRLYLLQKVFDKIVITPEVEDEYGTKLPSWINVRKVKNLSERDRLYDMLDLGEASSLALALETNNSTLIIDEKKGRAVAAAMGLNIIGSLKILVLAKRKNFIFSVQEVVNELSRNNFRFSKTVVESLLKEAGEM